MKNGKKVTDQLALLKKEEQRLFDTYSMRMINVKKIAHLKQLIEVLEKMEKIWQR